MTSSLGTMGKTKTSLLGVKNYRIKLKICTLVEDRKLYNIYSGFLKILKILDFVIIFLKKVIFWNFWGQKTKILKIRDSHFVDLAFLCIIYFCLHLTQKLYFWWIFKHLPFIGPKSREVTSQNSTYSKKFLADFDFLCTRRRQIDARRGVPSFMPIQ